MSVSKFDTLAGLRAVMIDPGRGPGGREPCLRKITPQKAAVIDWLGDHCVTNPQVAAKLALHVRHTERNKEG